MIKIGLYLLFASGGAYGLALNYPSMLDLYYSIMVAIGVIYGARTLSFAYSGMMVMLCAIYAIENNDLIWEVNIHALGMVYFVGAAMVLIFQTDDGFKVAKIIAGLILCKWLITMAIDGPYLRHTILNFLSIAQWGIFTITAARRIELNRGYSKKDNPFMLKLAVSWNQFKTHLGITNAA